jgi:GDP-L-fucose synthase
MRVFVAGHRGMVGSAIMRKLSGHAGVSAVLTRDRDSLDLTDQSATHAFLGQTKPDLVILAAARVGGIYANHTLPAEFIYQNLMIEANLIHGAFKAGVDRLLFLGSSCIYPRDAPQPIREEALMTGPLERTNAPYAVAKIAGITLCESYSRQYGVDYRAVMPTNLYGPHDNFHPEHSHVIPGLIRRFHDAKRAGADHVAIWGSGQPRRDFLHVDDLADALLFVADLPPDRFREATGPVASHLNLGSGQDISIAELAELIGHVVGFDGQLEFDPSKPDGTPRKLLDVTRIASLGWAPAIDLKDGIEYTDRWFLENVASS